MKKLKSSHYFHRQEFKHLAVDIYMTDAKTIKVSICWIFNNKRLFLILSVQVEKWFGKKKQIAAVRTVCSHIKNMFKGLTLVSFNFILETIL